MWGLGGGVTPPHLTKPELKFFKYFWSFKGKQARKAHSSAFCIDLHRQTLMAMIGNDDIDGQ